MGRSIKGKYMKKYEFTEEQLATAVWGMNFSRLDQVAENTRFECYRIAKNIIANLPKKKQEEKTKSLGPDYLGEEIEKTNGVTSQYSLTLHAIRRNISDYLDGQIERWNDIRYMNCVDAVKIIRKALCGEKK